MPDLDRFLIVPGVLLAGLGLLHQILGKIRGLGRLPGDIRFKCKYFSVYFALATRIPVSSVLSLLFWLFWRKIRAFPPRNLSRRDVLLVTPPGAA